MLVGLTYVLLISPCLLPDRESPMDELLSHPREVCRVVSRQRANIKLTTLADFLSCSTPSQ